MSPYVDSRLDFLEGEFLNGEFGGRWINMEPNLPNFPRTG